MAGAQAVARARHIKNPAKIHILRIDVAFIIPPYIESGLIMNPGFGPEIRDNAAWKIQATRELNSILEVHFTGSSAGVIVRKDDFWG